MDPPGVRERLPSSPAADNLAFDDGRHQSSAIMTIAIK
jgi:hypothetical protein